MSRFLTTSLSRDFQSNSEEPESLPVADILQAHLVGANGRQGAFGRYGTAGGTPFSVHTATASFGGCDVTRH